MSWTSGTLKVGTGLQVSDSTMIMTVTVSEPFTPAVMAVGTGWGATGSQVIFEPSRSKCCVKFIYDKIK